MRHLSPIYCFVDSSRQQRHLMMRSLYPLQSSTIYGGSNFVRESQQVGRKEKGQPSGVEAGFYKRCELSGMSVGDGQEGSCAAASCKPTAVIQDGLAFLEGRRRSKKNQIGIHLIPKEEGR
jgi:hypothetical protein